MQDENQQQMMAQENRNQETVSSTQLNNEDKMIENDDLPSTTSKPQANFRLFSFMGDNNKCKISNWMKMYERFAKRSNWSEDDMVENMPSYLEDEAFDYYVSHVMKNNMEWKQAKQQMVARFDQFDVEPFMEFLSLKWTPQMELKEYFKKMRALGMAAGLKEEDIVTGLTKGLPMHLRSEMATATTLQRWVAVAFCLEQRLESNSNSNNNVNYNKHNAWKNRRNHRNMRQQNKPRSSNQQQNHHTNDNMISSMTSTDQMEAHN